MFVRVAVVIGVALLLWAVLARNTGARGPEHRHTVEVGETLWSIAEASHQGDPRDGVWKLEQRNHLDGATIVPGEILVVP